MKLFWLSFKATSQMQVANTEQEAKELLAKQLKETSIEKLVHFIGVE